MRKYLNRLKNPATIIGLTGYLLTILSSLGFIIDNDNIMTVVQSICEKCVLLGILNNPDTSGIYFQQKK